jgi:Rrf2 family protein
MLVTREADYAIRCVLEVARQGRVSAARVAELQGISPTFLGKIVQSLARAGILSTRRGVGGGVTLAVPLEEVTLLRVIEAVEGPLCLNDCVADPPQCPQIDTCPVYPYLDRAQGALRALLTVSLDQLAKGGPLPTIGYEVANAQVRGNGSNPSAVPAIGGEG